MDIKVVNKIINMGFWNKVLDKDNNQYSTTNLFVIVISAIALLLLLMPIIVLGIEIFYNHTISTDLTGLAAYITSVSSMIVGVGIMKAWVVSSDNKLKGKQLEHDSGVNSQDI